MQYTLAQVFGNNSQTLSHLQPHTHTPHTPTATTTTTHITPNYTCTQAYHSFLVVEADSLLLPAPDITHCTVAGVTPASLETRGTHTHTYSKSTSNSPLTMSGLSIPPVHTMPPPSNSACLHACTKHIGTWCMCHVQSHKQ